MLGPLPSDVPKARESFGRFLKPRLLKLLHASGLDVNYDRGAGDFLYYTDAHGRGVEVLDLLGGYGASLFGHNHPELVDRAKQVLAAKRPFNAQASVRGLAGTLAARLSEVVGRHTGRSYVCTLANSGTEAVEAAIKHAELEHMLRVDTFHDRLKRTSREIRLRLRDQTAFVPESLFERAARQFNLPRPIGDLDELFARVFSYNLAALDVQPNFLALEGAFHGKSTGSLQLTHAPDYRSPWRRIGVRTVFLDPNDPEAIDEAIEDARIDYLDLEINEIGALELVERELVNVSAAFVEPIQGEGGVREIGVDTLRALRVAADAGSFPLVFDEIQSGMGRTGTFLASEQSGVRGDYYLLSKALGGGLAKLSALLVESGRYVSEYGYLHTSTFADDDFSSAIALGALELLDRDDGALMKDCRTKGERLLRRLREIKAAHPGVIADVRGRGLMIGIELAPQHYADSPLIRMLSDQNLLGFVVSGHLIHEERIRCAPALSRRATIRIEPSAYIEQAELDRFCDALERVVGTIERGDGFRLARFLVGRAGEKTDPAPERPAARASKPPSSVGWFETRRRFSRNVAFLGHFLEPGDVRHWDRTLAPFSAADCDAFLRRTQGSIDPFVVDRIEVQSVSGEVVNLTVIGLAFTPAQVMEGLKRNKTAWVTDLIEQGVELAKRLGCQVVGFGGYTSILTDACVAVVEDEITLTSGNSLTAAAAVDALEQSRRRIGIAEPRLGVLGAAGNIGAVLAQVASDEISDIVLVGRPGTEKRLRRVVDEVYFEAWKRLTRLGRKSGLAGAIAATKTVTRLRETNARDVERIGEAIRIGLEEELREKRPIRIETDLAALRDCNVVISATNSPEPVILPEHIGPGPVVVCDVAAPRDVAPEVGDREDVTVIKGGIVRAPLDQRVEVGGMELAPGRLYACLAEAILLGLTGIGENYSFGALTAARVRWVRELASQHGFIFEEHPA